VLVTSAERARHLRQPPVYLLGFGQGHDSNPDRRGFDNETASAAQTAGRIAFELAGLSPKDIDVCQIYDAFTYLTILLLEDYGFCRKGEGGPFVAAGGILPGGPLPTNTGGGQLAGYYLQGMTPISEGILQARNGAGERQVARHDRVLVANIGGKLSHHACLLLSKHAD
jgi:acetyl-CoA acetyltransferase